MLIEYISLAFQSINSPINDLEREFFFLFLGGTDELLPYIRCLIKREVACVAGQSQSKLGQAKNGRVVRVVQFFLLVQHVHVLRDGFGEQGH